MNAGNRILLRTTTRNARLLWGGTALIGLHQVCEAMVPILIGVIVDRAVAAGDPGRLALWAGVLAGLFLLLTTAYRNGARLLMRAIAQEGHTLRLEVTERILHPRGLVTEMRAGDLLTVSTSDADNTSYVLDYVPRIVGAVVATVVGAVALLVVSVPLGLVVLLATPVVLVVLQVAAPLITRRVADQQEAAGAASTLATDLVTGLRPLRGIGAEAAAAERYREVSRRSLRALIRASVTQGGYLAVSTVVSTLLAGGIAVLAGWFALRGRISVGEFITVIGLASFLLEPFGTLAIVPSWFAEAKASADRIASIMESPHVLPSLPTAEPVAGPVAGPGELRLTDVHFGPLRGLDLHVRPGEFVGLVPGACGDALVRLLAQPVGHTGEIVAAAVHVEPHRADLFTGTLRGNLVSDDDPVAALAAARADEVVALHDDGLDHAVAERGADLSGGQRQRIALARALLARPPVLVLHDPTTAVDAVTEHAIAQGIRAFRSGLTTLVVTTSPALLAATDRVVLLSEGAVAAEGSHADLSAAHEDYRKAVLR